MSGVAFRNILDFLYTGNPPLAEGDVQATRSAAKLFGLSELVKICTNIEEEQDFLNPSIGTWLNDCAGATAKQIFLTRDGDADVFFKVDGHRIPAHRAVLAARCPVMAQLFKFSTVEKPEVSTGLL